MTSTFHVNMKSAPCFFFFFSESKVKLSSDIMKQTYRNKKRWMHSPLFFYINECNNVQSIFCIMSKIESEFEQRSDSLSLLTVAWSAGAAEPVDY